ncbi:MAG: hypothetical protein QF535_03860, partial [Anaerolineales bacterium]|nr:hypothetical protein [Anaerolineales bacterium]
SRRSLTRMVGIPTGAIFLSLVLVFSLMNSSQSYRLIELERRAAFNLGQLKKGNYRTAKAYAPKSHRALSEWLKYNTAPSAVILHPPQINEVRSIAERASVLLNTLPPFGRRGTIEWLERFSKVQYYCEKNIKELNNLAVSYGASYIAIESECAAIQEISLPLYSSDSWYVVQVEGKTN